SKQRIIFFQTIRRVLQKSIRRTDIQQINTAYSNQLNMAYRSPDTVAVAIFRIRFHVSVFSPSRAHPTDHLCLFSGNRLTKKGITMAEPNLNEYISVTRKNLLSDDNEGRMVEKSFLEIQGTFLVKIHDKTFNGIIGENAFKHIDNFLEVVGPLKIKGLSQDRFRLCVFLISLAGAASKWFKKDCIGSVTTWENLVEKFEGNLFDFETPLCKAFNEFNYLLKIDTDLFTFDIHGIETYEDYELNNNMTGDLEEPWSDNEVPYQLCDHVCEPYSFKNGKTKGPTCSSDIDGFYNGGELPRMVRVGCMTYFQDHKWYDELTDGKPKEEALMHKAVFEESWGDATFGVMKFCAWLKSSFENFHELDYDVLLKLEECWNYRANNAGSTQDNQEYKKEHHDLSICNIRRFEMIKYSFDADDEYVAIKEHEHLDHLRTNIDACQDYRELFRIMDEGWLVTKAKEE
ncbi:hypothetical protein Tco_1388580, partial [Tanacetum coccineum]